MINRVSEYLYRGAPRGAIYLPNTKNFPLNTEAEAALSSIPSGRPA